MNLDLGSFAFGSSIQTGGGTPSWGTSLGQSKPDYKFTYPGAEAIVVGMTYCAVPSESVSLPLGKGGRIYQASDLKECVLASLFRKVYINGKRINHPFVMVLIKESSDSHSGRRSIKYSDKNAYASDSESYSNADFVRIAQQTLGLTESSCWFVYKFEIYNQDELHMSAVIVDEEESVEYENSSERKTEWLALIPDADKEYVHASSPALPPLNQPHQQIYRPYLTAIKSKPFLLLAGISGTGKSRIVRELARACWDEGSEKYKAQKPENFEMIQVKPNWHDSTELIGYVSRVSGEPVYVIGDFLRFVTKAWENLDVPYFLCLDEMNLAPVEQYFAEFLSVIESRKSDGKGHVTTDPILKKSTEDWYRVLTAELTGDNEALRTQFLDEGIALPQNLIVVGTVNMDETTFSFSRKVLDRAMTIEMNEVDLWGGLDYKYERIGKLSGDMLIGKAVEGVDVYADNKEVCDIALEYLKSVNEILDKTPFKVAYRTRNEFLLYVVNNLPYTIGEDGTEYSRENVIATALDEITSMKVLSRIEGDDTKVPSSLLAELKRVIREQLLKITGEDDLIESVSLAKLDEMQKRLKSGYTSFWS